MAAFCLPTCTYSSVHTHKTHTDTAAGAAALPHGMPSYAPAAQPVPLDDHGASSVGGVGGPVAGLLESNYALLNQFKANMQACRVHENTDLLVRFRDNILSILGMMNAMGGVMADMPPLPVRMNVELANNFLPKAGMPAFMPPPLGMVAPPPPSMYHHPLPHAGLNGHHHPHAMHWPPPPGMLAAAAVPAAAAAASSQPALAAAAAASQPVAPAVVAAAAAAPAAAAAGPPQPAAPAATVVKTEWAVKAE